MSDGAKIAGMCLPQGNVDQALAYPKWIIENAGIRLLADFNEEKIERASAILLRPALGWAPGSRNG